MGRLALVATTDQMINVLSEVKRLAVRYRELTGRPLGVTGEVAEYEACRLLGLEPAPVRSPGYDAIRHLDDGTAELVQIKGRCILPGAGRSQQIGGIKLGDKWDAVLLVLLDERLEATAIFRADRALVEEALRAPGSRARNERGALSVAKFRQISEKLWPAVT
jgi:hypothetical protein